MINLNKIVKDSYRLDKEYNFDELLELQHSINILIKKKHKEIVEHQINQWARKSPPKMCSCGHEYSRHTEEGCMVVHREGDDDVYCECTNKP